MKKVLKFNILYVYLPGYYHSQNTRRNMVLISGGSYKPLYVSDEKRKVESFYMDVYPVTNREFLEFVKVILNGRSLMLKNFLLINHI
jgi:formylglycine-generating enzyme